MKLKFFALAGAAFLALSSLASAGDLYRINHYNSLITANLGDLQTFFELHGDHSATRAFYNRVANRGGLFNLQPGAVVNVVGYYGDIAQIEWGSDGQYHAYIASDDLSRYLGSN
jgi:hypothetical protein